MRRAIFLMSTVVIAQVIGCAASREYRCPDPIGPIIRDDCDSYRTRYESLRVDLSAGVGSAKLEAGIHSEALRDPSELIQVMSARMTALCHDFNACRMTAADYRRRREEIDKSTTAIVALGEQLKRSDLTQQQRQQLLEKLMRLLGEPTPRKQTPPATLKPENDTQKHVRKQAFFSSDPWFGSLNLPPIPGPVKEGFPRLITHWGRPTIDHVWVPKSKDKPHNMKVAGYAPRIALKLWGHIEADDQVEIRFDDGRKQRCPVKQNGDGVNVVRCKLPKDFFFTKLHYGYQVGYYSATRDAWATLGSEDRDVAQSVEKSFKIDYDRDMRAGWLSFLPEPRALPADFERPHLFVSLRLRDYQKATARCWVGDQAVTGAIRTSRGSGQSGTLQDRPRYEKINPHSSRSVAHPFIEWWHYEFPLPFIVFRAKGTLPEGMQLWPPKTGAWLCRVMVDAVPVRELLFKVKKDGKLEPLDGQLGKSGDMLHPWWRVETRILPNKIEATREDQRAGT
ncbi:MAG TPA: hypothetical protein VM425_07225 [Myxococcota bacterium]|nr:hypothetical protein [Myxococcota bacterium]